MLYKTIFIFILFLLLPSLYAVGDCGFSLGCAIETTTNFFDDLMYKATIPIYNVIFSGDESLLQTDVFKESSLAYWINDLILTFINLLLYAWVFYLVFKSQNTSGDPEKIKELEKSQSKFISTLIFLSFVTIFFSLVGSFTDIIQNIFISSTIENLIIPDPEFFGGGNLFTAGLRFIMLFALLLILFAFLLLVIIQLFSLPIFTLWGVLHFSGRIATSNFLRDILILLYFFPVFFFLFVGVIGWIICFLLLDYLYGHLIGGIFGTIGAGLIFWFWLGGIILKKFISGGAQILGSSIEGAINKGFGKLLTSLK